MEAPDLRCASGRQEAETALQYRLPGDLAGRVGVARRVAMFLLAARFPPRGRSVCPSSNIFTPKGEGEAYENYDRFEKGWVELQNHESNLNWLSECEQVLLASGRKAQQAAARYPQSEALLRAVMDPIGVSTTPKSLASTTAQSLQSGCCCHRLSLLERWKARYFV